jgi:hypothetical protein
MPAPHVFEYAFVRVVPRVERQEFVNAGVIVFARTLGFLEARIALDERRLLALDPQVALEDVRCALAAVPRVCAGGAAGGPIGRLSQAERFHWLVSPGSAVVQPSPVHSGLCHDPRAALEHLLHTAVMGRDT